MDIIVISTILLLLTVLVLLILYVRSRTTGLIKVSELRIFPIKSCGELRLRSVLIERAGLRYDREFAIVNAEWEAQTQKKVPKLATICCTNSKCLLLWSQQKNPPCSDPHECAKDTLSY